MKIKYKSIKRKFNEDSKLIGFFFLDKFVMSLTNVNLYIFFESLYI